jgi:hypothetical protein
VKGGEGEVAAEHRVWVVLAAGPAAGCKRCRCTRHGRATKRADALEQMTLLAFAPLSPRGLFRRMKAAFGQKRGTALPSPSGWLAIHF